MEKKGWSGLEIIVALHKKRTTITDLARDHQLADDVLVNTLREPNPKGEKIIAEKLGIPPEEIWPSRYK